MQDSENGYIQIPRAHPVWYLPPNDKAVAFELIRRATHKDISIRIYGQSIELKRGQVFTSVRALSRDCQIHRESVRRILDRLQSTHFSTHQSTYLGIVVTVLDYNYFNNSKGLYRPTERPTNRPEVVHFGTQGGAPNVPPNNNEHRTLKINNSNDSDNKDKNYKEPDGRKPLTLDNFDRTEIPGLVAMFSTPVKVAEHLRNRGFIEDAVKKIVHDTFKEPVKGGPLSECLRRC